MKKINVEYGTDGRIINLTDDAAHYEQENKALQIDAIIPTEQNVRGYINASNGNSAVLDVTINDEGVYTLVLEDTFMAKGTLYVGFEVFDDNGYTERFEPLKVYIDSFVNTGGENTDNVYVVTVEIDSVKTLPPEEQAYVENVGNKKDMKLKFGIPQGIKGEKGDTATVSIGTVETVPPDVSAYVENVGTEHDAVLNFYITKGDKGDKGDKGETGNDGYTPQKGKDYYTPEEAEQFVAEVEQKYAEAMNNKVDKEDRVTTPEEITPIESKLVNASAVWEFVDDAIEEVKRTLTIPIDEELSVTSINPVQNRAVSIGIQTLENNISNDYVHKDYIEVDLPNAEVTSYKANNGVYPCTFVDTKAREMIANTPMQKIFEVTTTEEVDVITDDALKNLKLDEIYVYIKLGADLTTSQSWNCSVNGLVGSAGHLYGFETKATAKAIYFMIKGKRMCENLWFTQKFAANATGINNQPLYASYNMNGIDYINKLKFVCPGLPAGSTVVVCGRKVVD